MGKATSARRDVLKRMAAAGAIGLPAADAVWHGTARRPAHPPMIRAPASNSPSATSSFGETPPAAC